MKKREAIFRTLTTICFICFIGTFGGIEQGFLSWGRGLAQSGLFVLAMVFCHEQAEAAMRAARRRKRKIKG